MTTIFSERLALIPMTPAFLQASLDDEWQMAQDLIGLDVSSDWSDEKDLMALRLEQLQNDPQLQPWLLRAIGLRSTRAMVGHIGFHSLPAPDYLRPFSPGGIEFGYTIFPAFRRQGYAYEASMALMEWAHSHHGVTSFVLSISPTNQPSLGLAQKIGFQQIGTHVDEEDGPEDVFEYRFPIRT